jgi:hypothetical protein
MTVGTQVEIVWVERIGAGAEVSAGGEYGALVSGPFEVTSAGGEYGTLVSSVGGVYGLLVSSAGGGYGWVSAGPVGFSVTGQTVVEAMMVVVTWPTGQLVTVGAQEVMVYSLVS